VTVAAMEADIDVETAMCAICFCRKAKSV